MRLGRVGMWVTALGITACGASGSPDVSPDDTQASALNMADGPADCTDLDGDGHGDGCDQGPDCDDEDPTVSDECGCTGGAIEGCPCTEGVAPVECDMPAALVANGSVLCKTGVHYCRDGAWTECVGIALFEGR